MAASENPLLNKTVVRDPTLFCTAFKRSRFYLFSKIEPDSYVYSSRLLIMLLLMHLYASTATPNATEMCSTRSLLEKKPLPLPSPMPSPSLLPYQHRQHSTPPSEISNSLSIPISPLKQSRISQVTRNPPITKGSFSIESSRNSCCRREIHWVMEQVEKVCGERTSRMKLAVVLNLIDHIS